MQRKKNEKRRDARASEQRSSVSSAARAVDAASSARCLRPPRQKARHRGAYERALYAPGVFLKSGLLRAKEREWVKLLDSKKEREREKKKISLLHQLLLLCLSLSPGLQFFVYTNKCSQAVLAIGMVQDKKLHKEAFSSKQVLNVEELKNRKKSLPRREKLAQPASKDVQFFLASSLSRMLLLRQRSSGV